MHSSIVKARLFSTLILLAVLVAACAPQAASPAPAEQPAALAPTATLLAPVPTLEHASQPTAGPTQELAPTPLPIATSRGPNLEASDPSTISMASGGVQFVEFFEFW
jgi:hypothetical protein